MYMKKSLLLVAGMMAGSILFAQDHQGHKRGQYESMKTVLSLDEKQDAAIRDINKKHAEEYAALKKDSAQTRDEKKKAGHAIQEQRQKEISAVLTPEQNAKWKAHRKEQTAQRKEQMKQAKERRYATLKADLSLTDEQATKLKAASKDFAEKARALAKNSQRDRAEFKKLKADREAKMRNILSAEQYQKWSVTKKEKTGKKAKHGPKK
jgi:Spy/CpxP family protein refolding chaperone